MSKIVRCPKCELLLREPPLGTPFYQCSNCETILQAKHATKQETFLHNRRLEKVKFSNRLLMEKNDSGMLPEVVSQDTFECASSENLSTSDAGKDSPSYKRGGNPKTVRTFYAFQRYQSSINQPLYNAPLQVNRQISSNNCSTMSQVLLEDKNQVDMPDIAQNGLLKDIKIDKASLNSLANGFIDRGHARFGESRKKLSFYSKRSTDNLRDQADIKEDVKSADFESVLDPDHQKPRQLESSMSVPSLTKRESVFGTNDALSAAKDMFPFPKQSKLRLAPIKSTSPDESNGLAHVNPHIKGPVEHLKRENTAQPVENPPAVLLPETGRNGGKVQSISNGIIVSKSGNNLLIEHNYGFGSQSAQRSEDLYEVTSEIDEYETSEQSFNMDEAEMLDSESQSQLSEDMDSVFSTQQGSGTSATARDFVKHDAVKGLDVNDSLKIISLIVQEKGGKVSSGKEKVDIPSRAIHDKESTATLSRPASHVHESSSQSFWSPDSEPLHAEQKPLTTVSQQKLQEKALPFLPSAAQAPYVVCKHCRRLLKVPPHLPITDKCTQKLRCGACLRILVFAVQQPDFIDEHNTCLSPQLNSSPADFSKDTHTSSDEMSASKSGSQTQASISQPKPKRSLKFFRSNKFWYPSEPVIVSQESETHSSTQDVFFQSSDESGEIFESLQSLPTRLLPATGFAEIVSENNRQSSGFPMCKESTIQRIYEMDSKEPYMSSLQNSRTDSDCDSSKSTEDISWASASPVAMSPLHELFGSESALQVLGNPSLKDQVNGTRRTKWNFRNIMRRKRQVKDAHRQVEKIPFKVVVNGTTIPYSLIKKAEESAGPIHPGSYWYDYRAGFWGVAGGPCLGIVAPFIEEFDYPLSRGCSGGKTGVIVNGRELHHTDLEKLVRRGLASVPGKAYKVEIDGRVVDEATGEELKGLGRLAPSIEVRGRGYGMFVPDNQRDGSAR